MPRAHNVTKSFNAQSIASETVLWTPAAGKRVQLIGGVIACSVAGAVIFHDANGGVVLIVPVAAGVPVSLSDILDALQVNGLSCIGPGASTLTGSLLGNEV